MATTMTLGELMSASRQRADMFPTGYIPSLTTAGYFVTDPELISYINQSYFELYDLLINVHEMWYSAPPLQIATTGAQLYPLPNGTLYSAAPALYKLQGVDLGVSGANNAWVTVKRFNFISRNRYVYPQLTTTYLGVFNLRYNIVGDNLMFIPPPSAGQYVQLWYSPRLTQLTSLSQTVDGISGWTEYIITDAAIKMMQKEESDVTVLAAQKMALIKRIEESAANRDEGLPETISNVRTGSEMWGIYGPNGDGPSGGF